MQAACITSGAPALANSVAETGKTQKSVQIASQSNKKRILASHAV